MSQNFGVKHTVLCSSLKPGPEIHKFINIINMLDFLFIYIICEIYGYFLEPHIIDNKSRILCIGIVSMH